MDLSLISAAGSALSVAREYGKAAIGLRDFNELAAIVAQMNEQILKAQDSLFAHNAQLCTLQNEVFETREKLRKAEAALVERGKYALFEISPGVVVYRSRASLEVHVSGAGDPCRTEPEHYVCQRCFDKGERGILIRMEGATGVSHQCPLCNRVYLETEYGVPRGASDYNPYP